MPNIESLVIRARDGDLNAYGELVRRFQDMACVCAYGVLGDYHLAEDVVQESFVQAYRYLGNLRNAKAFPGWFQKIVITQCYRLTRRKKLLIEPIELALNTISEEFDPSEAAGNTEMHNAVLEAIRSMPERQRDVTSLFYIEGLSQRDISTVLEIPVTTVNNRLYASRTWLRERMSRLNAKEPLQVKDKYREMIDCCSSVLAPHGQLLTMNQLAINTFAQYLKMEDGAQFILWPFRSPPLLHCQVKMLELFQKEQFPSPKLVLANKEPGFVLIEYIGKETLQEKLESAPKERQVTYMTKAVKLLAQLDDLLEKHADRVNTISEEARGMRGLAINETNTNTHTYRPKNNNVTQWAASIQSETIRDIFELAGVDKKSRKAVRALKLVPLILEPIRNIPISTGPVHVCPHYMLLKEDDELCYWRFATLSKRHRDHRLLTTLTENVVIAGTTMAPLPRTELAKAYHMVRSFDIPLDEWLRQLDGQFFHYYWYHEGLLISDALKQGAEYATDWFVYFFGLPSDRYRQMVENYLIVGSFSQDPTVVEFQSLLEDLLGDWIRKTRQCTTLSTYDDYLSYRLLAADYSNGPL